MQEMPKELKCNYIPDVKGECHYCAFDEVKNKGVGSCHFFIDVPTIDELLIEQIKAKQIVYLEEIKEKVKKEQATLALGAGISIPSGLPGWCGLISQLFGYAMQFSRYTSKEETEPSQQNQQNRLESELIKGNLTMFEGGNVLETGQYISEILKRSLGKKMGDEMLKELISSIIHKGMRACELEGTLRCSTNQEKREQAEKDSLRAVAYLLQAHDGFRRAITYNYDTLVEECLIYIYQVKPIQILSHPGKWSNFMKERIPDSIDIFHVHGCVPRREYEKEPDYRMLKESERVILSEDSYYSVEQLETYNWMNSIQSYYLNRDTCVFVGFSADDYNFRRILRQMGEDNNRPRHFLVLTVDDLVKDIWQNVCRNNLGAKDVGATEIRQQVLRLLNYELETKRYYWERKNIIPIWVTVQDIPKTLLSMI